MLCYRKETKSLNVITIMKRKFWSRHPSSISYNKLNDNIKRYRIETKPKVGCTSSTDVTLWHAHQLVEVGRGHGPDGGRQVRTLGHRRRHLGQVLFHFQFEAKLSFTFLTKQAKNSLIYVFTLITTVIHKIIVGIRKMMKKIVKCKLCDDDQGFSY